MKQPKPKLPAGVTQEFIDGIQGMSTDELKATVVTLQIQNQENEEFKLSTEYLENEEEFDCAKAHHDYIAGPVKEVTVSIRNRTKLVIKRLKEKGGA